MSPSDPDATALRDLAVALARRAGDLLTTGRAEDLLPGTKSSPTDLVTVMDRAAERLVLVTPSTLVAIELADEPGPTVLMTGGLLRPGEPSLIGIEAVESLARYNCDTFAMGVAGVDAVHGFTDYHRDEGLVKRAAINAADRVIVAADHSKLGRVHLMNIAPLRRVETLVTDGLIEHPALAEAVSSGLNVICVPSHSSESDRAFRK